MKHMKFEFIGPVGRLQKIEFNMKKKLTVHSDNVIEAHKNGCQETKKALETLFPDQFEKKLPESWEEHRDMNGIPSLLNVGVRVKYFDAFKALKKLIELRDVYNDGWEPDWRNIDQIKWCIVYDGGLANANMFYTSQSNVLAFETREKRDKFLENFRGLIEEAKELL